jgi:hypothetical protein
LVRLGRFCREAEAGHGSGAIKIFCLNIDILMPIYYIIMVRLVTALPPFGGSGYEKPI